ncbi:MAG: beta-propeller domain-containing protein, partial [Xanthomonadales bacterium]|nr:beta-propeller domain-containing protein [Xanthomonadales bacterium]
ASGREQAFRLAPFTNEETLLSYLRTGLVDPGPYAYALADVAFSPAPVAAEVSSTNLQVAGVDEADVVKTDGGHVYALDHYGDEPATIRVLAMDGGGELSEINRLEVPEGRYPNGLYLVNERPDDRPDLLIVTFGRWDYAVFSSWFSPYPWVASESGFRAYDVSDPANPQHVADVVFDGGTVETRRIGETLYIVSRVHVHDPDVANAAPEVRADLAQSLGAEDLLPSVRVNGAETLLVTADTTLLPPQPPGFRYPELLTVSAFDLGQPDAFPRSVTMAGLAETVHVSRQNLFVATSRFASSIDPGFDALTAPSESFTDIHQFALADGQPSYTGSGAVSGYLAWGGTSPSFSFSEYEGHLRVVTSGPFEHGEHRVSVLELGREDGALAVRGFVPNAQRPERIGKPGELLYGVRFVEDRLYAVTFKSIDPLYVVDLARPGDPKVLGELEVTGFSNYLHPLPGKLLLGFGKEAVPAETVADGNFAWYQGLQLSLFDVTEPLSPRLVNSVELGRRGSDSSALFDHHAFTYLPADAESGRPARVAIPVVLHDAAPGEPISEDPSHFYRWQATGLAAFEVFGTDGTAADLVLADLLVTHTPETDPDHGPWQDANPTAARAILTGDHVYFFLRGEFFSSPWAESERLIGPF